MNATSADLIEHVLPAQSGLRQWVLTFPFSWRPRLGSDGELLRRLTRLAIATVLDFYTERAAAAGRLGARSGAVAVVQRTCSDLRLNPHLHLIVLDGSWSEEADELVWDGLGHLRTREVGEVLERCVRRMERHLRRHRLLRVETDENDPETALAASAVSGQLPPAGPQWTIGLAPLRPQALAYDKPRCASLSGFTLHADTVAGAVDQEGREALLRYVLRPPLAKERLELRPDGLVRINLKKAFADGTLAVEMDPLSLRCRLATSVPPPRLHTLTYAGVLAAASAWRPRLAPKPAPDARSEAPRKRTRSYRMWADLLARTFAIDALECPRCKGRMRLIAMITKTASIERFLTAIGEATELPRRSPGRAPPYWRSRVLRRLASPNADDDGLGQPFPES